MNFPGLDSSWCCSHHSLRGLGIIRPWTIDGCLRSVDRGDRILVVANTALGDSILCTPLIKSLSDAIGPDRVGFLVRAPFTELYEKTPWISDVLPSHGKFRGFAGLRHRISRKKYRIALIANCTEPDLIPWLWWSGVRGFLRYRSRWSVWNKWFANRKMMRKHGASDYASGNAVENNLAMLQALAIHPSTKRILIYLPQNGATLSLLDDRTGKRIQMDTSAAPLVLIHPGASRPGKCWPVENWARVASALHSEFKAQIIVTGGAAETRLGDELCRFLPPGALNIAGKLSLRELAALQHRAAIFLSGDTGTYHLAVSVDCPTVTLFAPVDRGSSSEACGPYGVPAERHRVLQTEDFGAPITAISADAVVREARNVLRLGGSNAPQ